MLIAPIRATGFLSPKRFADREVVWFSANPTWEESAGKKAPDSRALGKQETTILFDGLYRIGVASSDLVRWNDWKKTFRLRDTGAAKRFALFESYGNPDEWWCSFEPVESYRWLSIERLDDDGVWRVVP